MRLKRVLFLSAAAGGSALAGGGAAQASVSFTGTAYTQDFDSLPSAPLNVSLQSTVPWTDDTTPAANRTTILGWYLWHDLAAAEGGANSHQRFRAGDGSSATGSFYSFGRAATNPVTDRALGVLPTNILANEVGSASNTGIYFGVRLTNNTGSTLDNFSFTYSGEQWRGLQVNNLTQEFESLTVDYSLSATTIKGTAGQYTNLPGATFTGPNGGWDTGGRLDGNSTDPSSPAGQNKITGLGATVTGINWAPGADLFIRWQALNTASNGAGPLANDHGLAIDDFNFNAVVPPPIQTYYWDTDGSTPGAGGASPTGNWNGSAQNFNTDAAGGAGTLSAAPNAADTVVFAAGSGATGSYTVNVSGSRTVAAMKFKDGNATLTGGTVSSSSYEVASGASGTIASAVTGSVTKTGPGTLTITSTNSYTGGTTVQAGKLVVNRLHENNPVTITGGTLQVADSSPTFPSHPAGNNAFVSRPGSMITIANNGAPFQSRVYNGTLDLGNNDLIIDYSDPFNSPRASIEDMVRSGFNFGDWFGTGITSSAASSDFAGGLYALGVADNSDLIVPFGDGTSGPLFDGQVVDDTTVLVKFTHRADIDLDGVITSNDAAVFNGQYTEGQAAHWATGDLDYDGIYSSNDAAFFNGFYDESLQSLPEPGALSLLGLTALGLARRRRCQA